MVILLAAVFGPTIVPYEVDEYNYDADGDLLVAEGPSSPSRRSSWPTSRCRCSTCRSRRRSSTCWET
jgi:hypothetical protein